MIKKDIKRFSASRIDKKMDKNTTGYHFAPVGTAKFLKIGYTKCW